MRERELKALAASEEKLLNALSRLVRFCGEGEKSVSSLFAFQPECFVVDRKEFSLRSDLMLTGKTLVGKSLFEEGADLFLAAPRVKKSLSDAKEKAAHLGMELSEIEASQKFFSMSWKSSFMSGAEAAQKYFALRELVSEAAAEKELICLFQEQPFRNIKGPATQLYWTFQTDEGKNLLDPSESQYLSSILTDALFRGLHRHGALIEACIGSFDQTSFAARENLYFVFQDIGPVNSLSLLITALQAALSQSLEALLDELERGGERSQPGTLPREFFLRAPHKRGPEMYKAFLEPASLQMFEDIFTERELEDLVAEEMKRSAKSAEKESKVFIDLFRTQILPACLSATEKLASSLQTLMQASIEPSPRLSDELLSLSKLVGESIAAIDELERVLKQTQDLKGETKAKVLFELIEPKREFAREPRKSTLVLHSKLVT